MLCFNKKQTVGKLLMPTKPFPYLKIKSVLFIDYLILTYHEEYELDI